MSAIQDAVFSPIKEGLP